MDCCSWAEQLDRHYGAETAHTQLEEYRNGYVRPATRILLRELRAAGVKGASLLDVGGGVGVVQHELVDSGVQHVTDVDAARSYLAAAREEAQRRRYEGRATYVHGDFVEVADRVPRADVVTLDRVLCCYPDVDALVAATAMHANRLIGLVYPRDAFWVRGMALAKNAWNRLRRNPDRDFIHSTRRVNEVLGAHRFRQRMLKRRAYWQVAVYAREGAEPLRVGHPSGTG